MTPGLQLDNIEARPSAGAARCRAGAEEAAAGHLVVAFECVKPDSCPAAVATWTWTRSTPCAPDGRSSSGRQLR